jgi:nonsense-mediated mRNA decay protein 3
MANVTIARAIDLGVNDETFEVTTHLGNVIHAGDSVLGYDLSSRGLNEVELNDIDYPAVVLVKKSFGDKKQRRKKRVFQLKELPKELEGQDEDKMDADREMFLQEIEEDEELRKEITLYKSNSQNPEGEVLAEDELEALLSELALQEA